jgi:uncharacterized protein (UPF0332 family)
MPRERHPPKKKHGPRPRPEELPPLSDTQRHEKAVGEFEKALLHISEAEWVAASGEAPNTCVHSAYYAMHHAAAAAILASGGVGKHRDVPKSHEHVIDHFEKIVEGEPEPLGSGASLLNRGRSRRIVADYGLYASATAAEAAELTKQARILLEVIRTRWNLTP